MSLINVVIHTDIRCICAQFADILLDPATYQEFLKARNDDAQKLLDVLQDVSNRAQFMMSYLFRDSFWIIRFSMAAFSR
jgi:predicted Zn-dependent peptidase